MTLVDALSLLAAWRQQSVTHNPDEQFSFFNYCLNHVNGSRSQLFQDLWVSYELSGLRSGFFVEFGAGDGVLYSNTHYLEKTLNWKGILAEPGRGHYPGILRNRDCPIDRRCVWSASDEELVFNQTESPELSTIDAFSDSDGHAELRKSGIRYIVPTVSLNNLLAEHSAPRRIDYISVDTEGSEYDILKNFDFSKYDVRVMTIEHNYIASSREAIYELMTSMGFQRKFETLSRWDDWYIKNYA